MSGLSRDEISRIIYDNGLFHGRVSIGIVMDLNHLERFANLVAAAEREACARHYDEEPNRSHYGYHISTYIRSRGQNEMP